MFRPVLRRAGSGTLPNRIQHGTEADPDRPEVGDLIHLDQAVHFARASQNFPHLVGTDRIQAASEGGELQHFKMRGMGNHLGYGENPVRIGPLHIMLNLRPIIVFGLFFVPKDRKSSAQRLSRFFCLSGLMLHNPRLFGKLLSINTSR